MLALPSIVCALLAPLGPGTKPITHARAAGRMQLAIPDMSPNSLLFTNDRGLRLDYFTGGNLKALWASIPKLTVKDCCPPLDYLVGGDLLALWASVVESNPQCLPTPVRAGRHAAITMSNAAPRCMPDSAVDFFAGGNLRSLWKAATTVVEPRAHRMRGRPAARPRMPGVVAFGAACPLDAEDLNFFSGGSLRCLWLRAASLDFKADCMRNEALNFFAGGDLLSLWKDAHC